MLILGLNWVNLDQKGPKMGGARFSLTANLTFLKEDHKISFYTKNQQNSIYRLEDIAKMLILGQKGANLDQKWPKMGRTRFFPKISLGYFINRPKMQFKYAKL